MVTKIKPRWRLASLLLIVSLLTNYSMAQTTKKRHLPKHKRHTHAAKVHSKSSTKAKKRNYMQGYASFYAKKFAGRKMANGDALDMNDFIAAHPTLPLGTKLKVTNLRNGRIIYVEVDDRMSRRSGHIIDLTERGAMQLGITPQTGISRVRLEKVGDQEFRQQMNKQCALASAPLKKVSASSTEILVESEIK